MYDMFSQSKHDLQEKDLEDMRKIFHFGMREFGGDFREIEFISRLELGFLKLCVATHWCVANNIYSVAKTFKIFHFQTF
jgi:hypothetical protein